METSPRAAPMVLSVADPSASSIATILERVESARKARSAGGQLTSPSRQVGLPALQLHGSPSSLDDTQVLHRELETSRREVTRVIASLHAASDRFAEDRMVLTTLVEKLQVELAASKAENKELQEQLHKKQQLQEETALSRREAAVAGAAERIQARNASLEAEVAALSERCKELEGLLQQRGEEVQDLNDKLACLREPSRFLSLVKDSQVRLCGLAQLLVDTAGKLRPAVVSSMKALGQGTTGGPMVAASEAPAPSTSEGGDVPAASEPAAAPSVTAPAFHRLITSAIDQACVEVKRLEAQVGGLPELAGAFVAAAAQVEARVSGRLARQSAVISALQQRLDGVKASQASLTSVVVAVDTARQAGATSEAALAELSADNASLRARLQERAAEAVTLNEVAQGWHAETQRLRGALSSARSASGREGQAKARVGSTALAVLQQCTSVVRLLQTNVQQALAGPHKSTSSNNSSGSPQALAVGDAVRRCASNVKALRKEVEEAGRVFTLLLTANATTAGGDRSNDLAVLALARETAATIEGLAPALAASTRALEDAEASGTGGGQPDATALPAPMLLEGLQAMQRALEEATTLINDTLAAPYPPAAAPPASAPPSVPSTPSSPRAPPSPPALATPSVDGRFFASAVLSSRGRPSTSAAVPEATHTARRAGASPFKGPSMSPPPVFPAFAVSGRPTERAASAGSVTRAAPVAAAAPAAAPSTMYSLGARGRARSPLPQSKSGPPLAEPAASAASASLQEADVQAVLAAAHPALVRKRAASARSSSRGAPAPAPVEAP